MVDSANPLKSCGAIDSMIMPLDDAEIKGGNFSQPSSPYAALILGESGTVYGFNYIPKHTLIQHFDTVPPVSIAVNRIANAVGSLPIHLINKADHTPAPEHPAMRLLNRPNKRMQKIRHDLLRDYTIWRIVHGNAYLMFTGNTRRPPLEIYLLNPSHMVVDSDSTGFADTLTYYSDTVTGKQGTFAEKYRFNRAKGTYDNATGSQAVYHVANFNACYGHGNLEGMSELNPLYYAINHYILSSQHNLSLLNNGARPSGAFMVLQDKDGTPATLTDEEFLRLKTEIRANYSGTSNAGVPMLLEGGLDWKPMQMSPQDLDFLNLRQDSEEMIYKNLGVPVQLVMSLKTTANNLSNFRLEFYENRILPLGDNCCSHLNNVLLSRYPDGDQYEFQVDRDAIDVLQEQRIDKRKSIENSTVLTIDEKRAMLFHNKPIKGGNKIVDPNGRPIAGEDAEGFIATPPEAVSSVSATTTSSSSNDQEDGEEDNESES